MCKSQELRLSLCEGESETVQATPVGSNSYRLEETPFGIDEVLVFRGDIIEASQQADGTHRFVRIVERGRFRHYDWILPTDFLTSRRCAELADAIIREGGSWECLMGCLVFVHLPEASTFDVEKELDVILREGAGGKASKPWWKIWKRNVE